MTTYNLGDSTYGIDLTGATDSTTALNAAWASIPSGSKVYLPSTGNGVLISGTIYAKPHCDFYGDGWAPVALKRDGDFGDTIVVGNSTTLSAGSFQLRDMAIIHGSGYVSGATTLKKLDGSTAGKATSGAHLRLYGAQQPVINNVRLWRMPYQVYFHGGSFFHIEKNNFLGIWDHVNSGCQEGIASVVYDLDSAWGNPDSTHQSDNQFRGATSAARTVSYNGVNVTQAENIGPQIGVLVYGLENGNFKGDYYGGHNQNNIYYAAKSGAVISGQKFVNTMFDSCKEDSIFVKPYDNSTAMDTLTIGHCEFNGQLNGKHGIFIHTADATTTGPISLYGLYLSNSTMRAHVGAPLRILGAKGGSINNNIIKDYNVQGASSTDAQWCSAGWFAWQSGNINVHHNLIGGNMQLASAASAGNKCNLGFIKDSGLTTVNLDSSNVYIAPT